MTAATRRSRLTVPALATSVAAWAPLAALAIAGALPAGRADSGSGLLEGPSWAFVAVVFTIPFTIFFGLVGLVLAWAARSRRAAWIAGGALIVLVLTVAALIAFTSEVSLG
ncbi:MAG TPA: hypothetical protein VFL66_08700 [Gaiellaceae bacterium]|nr:hypothetical protein [Gaiellaceae bacterium]